MLIYKPIPGQEEGNALFLQKRGVALRVRNKTELKHTLRRLLTNPEEIAHMKQAAANTLPGKAAEQAVRYILHLINEDEKDAKAV
jgi:processive 1,2-diacylglycerol beta-glucosyltransferase